MNDKNPLELDEQSLLPEVMDPVAEDPMEDPIVQEVLRVALAPFEAVLSPEELEEERRFLALTILTHPEAQKVYRRLRKDPTVAGTGTVAKDGPAEGGAAADGDAGEGLGDGTRGRRR